MNPQDRVIGILGGGQLAKMSAQAARKLGFSVKVLDPTPNCPASMVAEQVLGSFKEREDIRKFLQGCHVLTFDIEHVETTILKEFSETIKIIPSPEVLSLIQNKLEQRRAYQKAGLPIPKFIEVKTLEDLKKLLPCVQKSITGGYDGRGTTILKSEEDLSKALPCPSFVEEYLDLEKELGVMVVRSDKGEVALYDVVEMVFHPEGNLLDFLFCPADIDPSLAKEAKELALEAVKAINGFGLFGVELFLDKQGKLYVNEVAPRPHNSGHHTIEACYTSQFEQHIRVITGLPLGSTRLLSPAVMINLLGEEGYFGKPIYEGLEKAMAIPGVSVHIYGKKETFPLRKMGHVTILGETTEEALAKARQVKNLLKVKGEVQK
jgi:5-(carboxyamino)imidazole ribonucleotide synthase